MSLQGEFLDHLRDHVPERITLAKHLGGDGRVCCYYICAFSTLRKLLQDGVKCRNGVRPTVDLSSPDVQCHRRDVWLGHSDNDGVLRTKRKVAIHSCVNLFWNPINRTFEAFQRNGLLRAIETGNLEDGIVCLLELDADILLNGHQVYWAATNRNLASAGFSSFKFDHLTAFPWSKIYAYRQDPHDYRCRERAAELVIHIGNQRQSFTDPIPRSCFTRVIYSANAAFSQDQMEWLEGTGLKCHRSNDFKPFPELLKAERRFLSSMAKFRRADPDVITRLMFAFRFIVEFEARFGGPVEDRFHSSLLAHGQHGIGHVVRVMLWTTFLGTYAFGVDDVTLHKAAILAAMLHDLGRVDNWTDLNHGQRSIAKHINLVRTALPETELQNSCINAIRMHGIPDDECPVDRQDRLWEILKDADGLERGRFRWPNDKDGKGCRTELLRLTYVSGGRLDRNSLAEVAYGLARMTKYSQWNEQPCQRLLADVSIGIEVGLTQGVFVQDELATAQKLHAELEALRHELAMPEMAYDEYEMQSQEEERLFLEEQDREWQEWLENEADNDWDDHDLETGAN